MSVTRQESKVWVIKRESTRGTAEANSTGGRAIPVTPASEMSLDPGLLANDKAYGDAEMRDPQPGPTAWAGPFEVHAGADKLGELLLSLFGQVTTTELTGFVITLNTNDRINFNEGGIELTAQVAAGSYASGATSAVAGSLCEAIKTALEAVGAGTYTVSRDITTKKFTIVQTAGPGTFQLLWNTGSNKAQSIATDIGFADTADDTGSLTYTGDSAVESVYQHVFTPAAAAEHPLYTLFGERGSLYKKYAGTGVGQLTISVPPDNRLAVTADLLAKSEAAGEDLTPDYSSDLASLIFSDVSVTVAGAGSNDVRQASIQMNGNAVPKRTFQTTPSRDARDIVHGKFVVTATFQLYFEDETERAKFVAGTASSFAITATGQTLKAALKASLALDLPRTFYRAGPYGEVDGVIVQDFAVDCAKDTSAGYTAKATLVNREASYAA